MTTRTPLPGRVPDGSGDRSCNAVFNFENYGELLALVQNSLWAGAVLGLLGGLVGTFVMKRDLAFAVHGISELSFAGAAFALLIGADMVFGSLIGSVAAALLLGLMGVRARDKNSIIGVIMPFGLGLGILFLSLYEGRAGQQVRPPHRANCVGGYRPASAPGGNRVAVMAALCAIWRPLSFASVDPELAEARGVPVRSLALVFMVLLGVSVALSIQIVGALLVLALLITPAAAALRVTSSPRLVVLLSVVFAVSATVGEYSSPWAAASPSAPTSPRCHS